MDRLKYIKQTTTKRMTAEPSILVPLFVSPKNISSRFGWDMPHKSITHTGPRWIAPICAGQIQLLTRHLDDETFISYIDAVILVLVLQHIELSKGRTQDDTHNIVGEQLAEEHPELYRVMTAVHFHMLDTAT